MQLFPQDDRIEPQRYYELREKDVIKFGNSRYVGITELGIIIGFLFAKDRLMRSMKIFG